MRSQSLEGFDLARQRRGGSGGAILDAYSGCSVSEIRKTRGEERTRLGAMR